MTVKFGRLQDVRAEDGAAGEEQGGVKQTARQEAHERLHGVGQRGEKEDSEGLSRHAQLQHQQDLRLAFFSFFLLKVFGRFRF